MRNIRSIIFLFTLVFALGAFALQSPAPRNESKQSDEQGPGHQKRGHMPSSEAQVKHFTEVLNLTDNQQTAIKAILDDTHKQAETVLADKSLSQEDRKAKMSTLHETAHAKMREILNDEQKKKF